MSFMNSPQRAPGRVTHSNVWLCMKWNYFYQCSPFFVVGAASKCAPVCTFLTSTSLCFSRPNKRRSALFEISFVLAADAVCCCCCYGAFNCHAAHRYFCLYTTRETSVWCFPVPPVQVGLSALIASGTTPIHWWTVHNLSESTFRTQNTHHLGFR